MNLLKFNRPHWSFSSLNQILNICSLQFYYERIAKVPKAFTPLPLSFGMAFHRALEYINRSRMEGPLDITEDDGRDLFRQMWTHQVEADANIRFGKGQDAESCGLEGMELTACYIRHIDPHEQVIAVNETFAVPITDRDGVSLEKPLIGEIDTIVVKDGRPLLIDWKTSARRWPKNQAGKSMQATAYTYAYSLLREFGLVDFRFDILVKNKTPVMERYTTSRTAEQIYRMVELAKSADAIVEHKLFYPSEQGFYCGGCPVRDHCRKWQCDACEAA